MSRAGKFSENRRSLSGRKRSIQTLRLENPSLLNESFALRHQVFCQECNYFNPENYPDNLETDKFDEIAIHLGAVEENELIGSVRIIPDTELGFPIHEMYNIPDGDRNLHFMIREQYAGKKLGEVSRLAISEQHRGEGVLPALFNLAISTCKEENIAYLLCATESIQMENFMSQLDIKRAHKIREAADCGQLGNKLVPYLVNVGEFF